MRTEAAWVDGKEVVRVHYDKSRVTYEQLAKAAKGKNFFPCPIDGEQSKAAQEVFGDAGHTLRGALRGDKDPKYYLGQSALRAVPMTELQAVRVNARIRAGYREFLSPRQIEWLELVDAHPKTDWPTLIGVSAVEAFARFDRARRTL